MKILFANPTLANECDALHLGLASCATYLNSKTQHQAQVIDFVYHRDDWKGHLARRFSRFDPDAVAITTTTPYVPLVKKLADEFRKLRQVPVILGGPHATIEFEEMLEKGIADFIIRGEAEHALSDFLDHYESGGNYSKIDGLAYKQGDKIVNNDLAHPIEDMNALPALDWDIWEDIDSHLYFFHTIPVMGSRGCPYRCAICSTPWISRNTGNKNSRHIDPDLLCDHLENYRNKYTPRGMGLFFFYDLNFLINEEWVEGFAREYINKGLDSVPFSIFSRADHVNAENARLLKKSGCNMVRLGIESGNDFMRNEIYHKDITRKAILESVSHLKDAEISCQAYLVLGGPGETEKSIEESLGMMNALEVEYPTPFLFKVLAGNPIDEVLKQAGARLNHEEMAIPSDYLTGYHIINPNLKPKQIEKLRFRLFLRVGMQLIFHGLKTNTWRYIIRFFPYLLRGKKIGWTLFQIASYYLYYGSGNLEKPLFRPKKKAWLHRYKKLMAEIS